MCGPCLGRAQPPALRGARRGERFSFQDLGFQTLALSAVDSKVCRQNKVVYLEVQLYFTNAMRLDHTK